METIALLAIGIIAVLEAAVDAVSGRAALEFLVGSAVILGVGAALRRGGIRRSKVRRHPSS